MSLFDIIDHVFRELEKHGPEIVDQMQKAQDRAQERDARRQKEIEAYRARYSGMSNRELQAKVDQGVSGAERAALASIAHERRDERQKIQELYSGMSSFELSVEYKKLNTQRRKAVLDEPNADLRLAIISKILKDRGWYLNSDLEWCKY